MASAVIKVKPTFASKSELSSSFENIVRESIRNKGDWGLLQNDILFAATFWFMTECGFIAVRRTGSAAAKRSPGSDKDEEDAALPDNWKHTTKQIYEAQFILPPYEEHPVRLVALPADDILCINVLVSNVSPKSVNLKSLAISSTGYVPRPEAKSVLSKFSNLEYFRLYVKSTIIWPIRCSILTDEGVVNGSLIGLSDEIKLKIFCLLDVRDLLSVSETCHDLNRVCNDQGLWKSIFHKDFKSHCKCQGRGKDCEESDTVWKESYKYVYARGDVSKASLQSSLESFHTAPESIYHEVYFAYQ